MKKQFEYPDTVVYNNEIYDFGYYGKDGKCVIYLHGCRNMQDSFAVHLDKIRLATDEDKQKLYYGR